LNEWQRNIGLVPQNPYLLDATIEENVKFGLIPRDDEARLEEAIKLALVNEIAEGNTPVNTVVVGERGTRVSGGQAQRIAISRAFYRKCDLLVLDEATSALDLITERKIFDNLKKLEPAPTIIAIAHRVNSLKGCDRIFLIEDGRLIAQGPWQELIATSVDFRALVEASDRNVAA
jgi:ABC-type multidrug transport system fused ATPase/permease subunit